MYLVGCCIATVVLSTVARRWCWYARGHGNHGGTGHLRHGRVNLQPAVSAEQDDDVTGMVFQARLSTLYTTFNDLFIMCTTRSSVSLT